MTLTALLAHVAARWAVTRTPACGWVPDESETDMNERNYTRADMAHAWREGAQSEWLTRRHIETGEGHPGDPSPYEQEEA